jgi:formate dehydrogenase (coenzyme F420) beta subunit
VKELQDLARTLLAEKKVGVVVGYEVGPRGMRPSFATTPEQAERLVFDARAVQNLAAYLSPRRPHLKGLGKPAVVVKGCDLKAVAGLIREAQLARDDVVLIGVRCGGVLCDPTSSDALSAETLASRCAGCQAREPERVDHLVGTSQPLPPNAVDRRSERIAELRQRTPRERFAYWQEELGRCVRCHACRAVCPLCFCDRCIADKTTPQWIESSAHPRGNFAWHLTRAQHLAGRCVDCGECERVCPAGIPLTLTNRRMADMLAERFDYRVSDDPELPAPIGAFRNEDDQEFIR